MTGDAVWHRIACQHSGPLVTDRLFESRAYGATYNPTDDKGADRMHGQHLPLADGAPGRANGRKH